MDIVEQAVLQTDPLSLQDRLRQVPILSRIMDMPIAQKMAFGAVAIVTIAVFLMLWSNSRGGDYKVLFSNLSDKDNGAIVASLGQMNIPYKLADAGGAVMVPSDQVHNARLRLATQGLPHGGGIGFELMDGTKLGQSQFAEQVNYQRALEGELARSIQSLGVVQSARVHLAIPKQSAFMRDQKAPTASVVVHLHPGRVMDSGQILGVTNLVASSVPSMSASGVSIVDQNGSLLSQGNDRIGMNDQQRDYVKSIEDNYIQRIEQILQPLVGAGGVRAQVSADIDFSQQEETEETYKPNSAATAQAIRSQQLADAAGGGSSLAAMGVPGALSNQPPATPQAAIQGGTSGATSGPAGNTAGANAPPGSMNTMGNSKRNSAVNYEVDRKVVHTRNNPGTIRRVTAAIALNHKKVVDANGKETFKPFSDAELSQMTQIAREAIGFNKERGDSINVVNLPFMQEHETAVQRVTNVLTSQGLIGAIKEWGQLLLFSALGLYLFFGVLRPMLRNQMALAGTVATVGVGASAVGNLGNKSLSAPLAEGEVGDDAETEIHEDDDVETISLKKKRKRRNYEGGSGDDLYADELKHLQEVAGKEPQRIANVIREWVREGAHTHE